MGKKIILSQSQLNEIIGYCDNPEEDFKWNGGTEVSTTDSIIDADDEGSYGEPIITNKFGHSITNDIGALWKIGGVSGNLVMRESKKKVNEESAHGNSDIGSMERFGASDEFQGNTYNAATVKKHRYEKAKEKILNGTPEEKEAAAKTIQRMEQNSSENGEDIQATINQLNNREEQTRSLRKNRMERGERVISQHSRNGLGTSHSKQDDNKTIIKYY